MIEYRSERLSTASHKSHKSFAHQKIADKVDIIIESMDLEWIKVLHTCLWFESVIFIRCTEFINIRLTRQILYLFSHKRKRNAKQNFHTKETGKEIIQSFRVVKFNLKIVQLRE